MTERLNQNHRLMVTSLVLAACCCPAHVAGHGFPLLLADSGDGGLSRLNSVPIGQLVDDGFEISTSDPGIGTHLASTAPPSGTTLHLATLGGLVYWDGANVSPTEAMLTVEAPEFDSLGNCNPGLASCNPNRNAAAVDEYTIDADSGRLIEMVWHTFPGGGFWDAHGLFVLSENATPGVYGVLIRVASPTAAATEPVLLPLVFDPTDQWTTSQEEEAALLLEEAATAQFAWGDYDDDGLTTAGDFARWSEEFGAPPSVSGAGADGNADLAVDAGDYVLFRDQLQVAVGVIAGPIPEPFSAGLGALAALYIFSRRHRVDAV